MRPEIIITVALAVVILPVVAFLLVDLTGEITSAATISAARARLFDIPPYLLLISVILIPAFALIGLWRKL